MIKSKFSIVTRVAYGKDNILQSCYADQEISFDITFNGNKVYKIEGIDPKKIYARVLLSWTDGMSHLFIVLKTNKIYNIDNIADDKQDMIKYIVKHANILTEFESFDDIEMFSRL